MKFKDIKGKAAILRRIDRVKEGNFGDHNFIGLEVSELKMTVGVGYRVYYTKKRIKLLFYLLVAINQLKVKI